MADGAGWAAYALTSQTYAEIWKVVFNLYLSFAGHKPAENMRLKEARQGFLMIALSNCSGQSSNYLPVFLLCVGAKGLGADIA